MRSPAETNTWEYWIPGWSQALMFRDLVSGNLGQGVSRTFDFGNTMSSQNSNYSLASESRALADEAREQALEDREHTEKREDTAYQRAVADMRSAGLNPYTIGSSPASSSRSEVGEASIAARVQMLGYILDLKNLDTKNRKITNDLIGDILGFVKKK